MTYYITAFTNNRARLIVSETRTTDAALAVIIKGELEKQGHIVSEKVDG